MHLAGICLKNIFIQSVFAEKFSVVFFAHRLKKLTLDPQKKLAFNLILNKNLSQK